MKNNPLVLATLLLSSCISCSSSHDENDSSTTTSGFVFNQDKFSVAAPENDISITVEPPGGSSFTYTIPSFLTEKSISSDKKTEVFTASKNISCLSRGGYIIYKSTTYKDTISVVQAGVDSTITADKTGMTMDAVTLAGKMGIGWNLGNSLESCSSSTSASETSWGNPKATQALIDSVKAAGFKTIRIPCAWSGYIEDTTNYRIKDAWLARVKEVVDYCINDGLYVIVNSHWDGGWLENNPTYARQKAVNAKQNAIWRQIATYFRDYDEHLMFAGTNEVHVADNYNAPTAENSIVQKTFNQTFVDAVRSTGGKNTYRNLIVQAYNTNIAYAQNYLTMPTDATSNRLMVEVHFYDPYDFALQTSSGYKTQWGQYFVGGDISTWGQESWVIEAFGMMKSKFVDNHIPVVLGEFGAILRTDLSTDAESKHVRARNYYLNYVTKQALTDGLIPVYWDNGATGNNGFGLFMRNTGAVAHADAISAIISAGN